ncbi:hypothetical protein A2V82_03065, partial [candidate division KSB1 bacterium RBG_16_48_16]
NSIVEYEQGTKLAPRSYALVFAYKYFTDSRYYRDAIPPQALVLSSSHSTLGLNGLANSRAETISLFTPDTTEVASRAYTVPNADGFSEEKKVLDYPDEDKNWADAIVPGGTPGYANSIAPLDFDLAFVAEKVRVSPANITRRDSLCFDFWLVNIGINSVERVIVDLFEDANLDGIFAPGERLATQAAPSAGLSWMDTLHVLVRTHPLAVGLHGFRAQIVYNEDRDISNNQLDLEAEVRAGYGDVVVNEIYTDEKATWLEVYNALPEAVSLRNWQILFPLHKSSVVLKKEISIAPNGMALFVSPDFDAETIWKTQTPIIEMKELPALDSGSEIISLIDERGATIDSVYYSLPFSQDKKSVERLGYDLPGDQTSSWQFCPYPKGATPGEANAAGRSFADPAISAGSVIYQPAFPALNDSITLSFYVHNHGNMAAGDVQVFIYSILAASTDTMLVSHINVPRISPADSSQCTLSLQPQDVGLYTILFRVDAANDFYAINNRAETVVRVGYPFHTLVVNEILYNTEEKEQEWVELYNPSSRTVDLAGWSLRDKSRQVTLTDVSFLLDPGGYLVFSNVPLQGDSLALNIVNPRLPELNNSGDILVLYDAAGHVCDSLEYKSLWGGGRSVSLERIRFDEASTDSLNWASSIDPSGSTPGRVNSVSPKAWDVAVLPDRFFCEPARPEADDDILLTVTVENTGLNPLTNFSVFFHYRPLHSEESLLISDPVTISYLEPQERTEVAATWKSAPSGTFILQAQVAHPQDGLADNDFAERRISVSFPRESLVINEIMFNPLPNQGEWIELFNKSSLEIDLFDWRLADSDTAASTVIADSSCLFLPGEFVVLAADSFEVDSPAKWVCLSRWPSLSNSGDEIYLTDANGRVIDHVIYSTENAERRGFSLERISPSTPSAETTNWVQSVDARGHTAGRTNSVFIDVLPGGVSLEVSPDPFSPDSDGFEDVVAISCELPVTSASIHLKIYDIHGRMVRFLLNNESTGAKRTVFWDGTDEDGQRCRMGIYIVYLEALDRLHRTVHRAKKTLVLATRL